MDIATQYRWAFNGPDRQQTFSKRIAEIPKFSVPVRDNGLKSEFANIRGFTLFQIPTGTVMDRRPSIYNPYCSLLLFKQLSDFRKC